MGTQCAYWTAGLWQRTIIPSPPKEESSLDCCTSASGQSLQHSFWGKPAHLLNQKQLSVPGRAVGAGPEALPHQCDSDRAAQW